MDKKILMGDSFGMFSCKRVFCRFQPLSFQNGLLSLAPPRFGGWIHIIFFFFSLLTLNAKVLQSKSISFPLYFNIVAIILVQGGIAIAIKQDCYLIMHRMAPKQLWLPFDGQEKKVFVFRKTLFIYLLPGRLAYRFLHFEGGGQDWRFPFLWVLKFCMILFSLLSFYTV